MENNFYNSLSSVVEFHLVSSHSKDIKVLQSFLTQGFPVLFDIYAIF